jgi:dihydroneopterin aldolase
MGFFLADPILLFMASDRDQAIFEAAIKLGALYHQWVGTPVSPSVASTLETAIQESVSLQPFVSDIHISLDRSQMVENIYGYSELKGTMFKVDIITKVGSACCHARLHRQGDYPLMEIVTCYEEP